MKNPLSTIIMCLLLSVPAVYSGNASTTDLSNAALIVSPAQTKTAKAAHMLADEIEKRTGIRLPISPSVTPTGPAIVLGTANSLKGSVSPPPGLKLPQKAEGYAIWLDTKNRPAPTVYLLGCDDRGVLFAAGRLIRLLAMEPGRLQIPSDTSLTDAPAYPIRGHMIIPDGNFIRWDTPGHEQLIRDLVIFGTNSFEYNRPKPEFAELLDSYGLDLWVFFGKGKVVRMRTLEDVHSRLGDLKGLDHVFIPGGDSTGTPEPRIVLPAMKHFAPLLKTVHPHAKIWYSNQCTFQHAVHDNEYIFDYFRTESPRWFEGMVYGPWTREGIHELRRNTPPQYKLRHYPDICHNLRCQYAIPKWDRAFARTWGRDGIRVMPGMMARVHNVTAPLTDGFVAYNHTGCNNDIEKFVWSRMAWNPNTPVKQILREYGKVFFGDDLAEDVAQGLLMLEDNWTGPVAANNGIEKTLAHWQKIARKAGPASKNWRLELFLYKAFIDAYIQRKHLAEMQYEAHAYQALEGAAKNGVETAIAAATAALARIDTEFPTKPQLNAELESWDLHRYEDLPVILSNLYSSLNDRRWLEYEFDRILNITDKSEQLARIHTILHWEDPGPGGFYDNLGVEGKQPHLVRQKPWADDPGYVYSPIECNRHKPDSYYRQSWLVTALTRYDVPLLMRYENLDPQATYRIRVTYSSQFNAVVRLIADDKYEVHGPIQKPQRVKPREFDIPRGATADGLLNLRWQLMNQRRGPSVAEVWLIKKLLTFE